MTKNERNLIRIIETLWKQLVTLLVVVIVVHMRIVRLASNVKCTT